MPSPLTPPPTHTLQAAYLCLTQLLDYKHELVLLLVNTLLSDLKSDNFVVIATALVVTSKLIGADLINAGKSKKLYMCVGVLKVCMLGGGDE